MSPESSLIPRGRAGPRHSLGRKRSSSRRRLSNSSSNIRTSSRGELVPRTKKGALSKTYRDLSRSTHVSSSNLESKLTPYLDDNTNRNTRGANIVEVQPFDASLKSEPPQVLARTRERRSSVTFDLENTYVRTYKPSPRKFHREDEDSNLVKLTVLVIMIGMFCICNYIGLSQSSHIIHTLHYRR
jgi:hypothetical protein